MTQLSWITAAGSVANLLIGVPASVIVQAANQDNLQQVVNYKLITGSLPAGLSLNTNGEIAGTPTYATSDNYFTTQTYTFTVRAYVDGTVADRTFSIILSNSVNQDFSWVTPAGDLGTIPDGEYYSLFLKAQSTLNSAITYSFLSGELPTGMQLLSTGELKGVPTLLTAVSTSSIEGVPFRFTIRATNSAGHVNDRSFILNVTNVFGPTIEPTTTSLGAFFDGTYFNQQLNVVELNPAVKIQWSVKEGKLPPGVTLSSTGVLSGYIQPLELIGNFGPGGYDGNATLGDVVTEEQEYDYGPYDFNQLNQSSNFNFTIQAFDGANYDLQDYVIRVVSRSTWTADNTVETVDDTYITADANNIYTPVLLNPTTTLPIGRQNSYYAYKFDGFDFSNQTLIYSVVDTRGTFDADPFDPLWDNSYNGVVTITRPGELGSFDYASNGQGNLPGLILDSKSGWLYGKIRPQSTAIEYFKFGIVASKTVDNVEYRSRPITFTLPILGDVNNVIEWITPSNLGYIDNGAVSELRVQAKSALGKTLVYSIYDQAGLPAKLPQGLSLLPTGEISGRVSFESFGIDDYSTTFDKDSTTIDRTSVFTVEAATEDGTASTYQQFTLTLNIIDKKPYTNVYLKAMPSFDQRQLYNSVISDTEIFDPNLIYRPTDPWFGINKNIEMLFLPGLNPKSLNEYETAIRLNHWTKDYKFGSIKSAVVLDSNYQVKYEVVYVEVLDPEENSAGQGPGEVLDLSATITNPYIDQLGNEYKIVYPNSSDNMIKRFEENVGYADQSSLPPWMTSNQPGTTASTFNPPLGFTKAVVLAYTIPGVSKLIAYRLRNSGINFNNIKFSVDRYEVDNYYLKFFDTNTQTYIGGVETTFDAIPRSNIGTVIAKVAYAVSIPFSQINGRSIDYINRNGGLDGRSINSFVDGQQLIFAKQEGFAGAITNDGWVKYFDAYIGDNITTPQIEGYDSESYDTNVLVPGYLEKLQGTSPVNQRGGVWTIRLVNNTVYLDFAQEVETNDRVQILLGKTYSGAVMHYVKPTEIGQTVPYYEVFNVGTNTIVKSATTFNAGTTKFFTNRDHYYEPNSQDKYLKFPQIGVFD